MIPRDVEIIDLYPPHWRNLRTLIDFSWISDRRPARSNMLSIVHQGGTILRTYAPSGIRLPDLQQIDDPQELAKKLYYQLEVLERVQILEIQSLGMFSDRVMKIDGRQSLDVEEFLFRAFRQADLDPAGLSVFPPLSWSWNGLPLEKIREWLTQGPGPRAYFFGVTRDEAPWTSLILRVEAGKLRLITTLEHLAKYDLPPDRFPSRPQDLKAICDAIEAHVAPVRAAMICNHFVLSSLLAAVDKRKALTDLINEFEPQDDHLGFGDGAAGLTGRLFSRLRRANRAKAGPVAANQLHAIRRAVFRWRCDSIFRDR